MTDPSERETRDFDFSGLRVRLEGLSHEQAEALIALWRAHVVDRVPAYLLRARVGALGRDMTPGAEMVHGMTARFGVDGARFEQDEGSVDVSADGDASILLAEGPPPRRVWAIVNLVLAALGWRMADLPGGALHAAGIVLDGRAFVLIGPEGAGKSTFCRVAAEAGAVVLSDDVTLVDASGATVEALSAPFRHRPFPPPPYGRWPVAAILLPRHGAAPALEPLSRLAREARLAANLLYVGAGAGADPRVDGVVETLAARVPARLFTFAPDPSFVEVLRRFR